MAEGDCDVAFLGHLKSLYVTRRCGLSVKIMNAHGKGPSHAVDKACRVSGGPGYTTRAILVDNDLEHQVTSDDRASIRTINLKVVWSRPCLEGMLLDVLGIHVPHSSNECKRKLRSRLGCKGLAKEDYATLFPQKVLEGSRTRVEAIDELLKLFGHST